MHFCSTLSIIRFWGRVRYNPANGISSLDQRFRRLLGCAVVSLPQWKPEFSGQFGGFPEADPLLVGWMLSRWSLKGCILFPWESWPISCWVSLPNLTASEANCALVLSNFATSPVMIPVAWAPRGSNSTHWVSVSAKWWEKLVASICNSCYILVEKHCNYLYDWRNYEQKAESDIFLWCISQKGRIHLHAIVLMALVEVMDLTSFSSAPRDLPLLSSGQCMQYFVPCWGGGAFYTLQVQGSNCQDSTFLESFLFSKSKWPPNIGLYHLQLIHLTFMSWRGLACLVMGACIMSENEAKAERFLNSTDFTCYRFGEFICNSPEIHAINSVINLGCNLPSWRMMTNAIFLGNRSCNSCDVEATDSMTLISQRVDLGGISFLLEGLPHYPMFYFSIEVWKCLASGNL